MIKSSKKNTIYEYAVINFGLILLALAMVIFLIPAKLASGGVFGIATITYHLFSWPAGLVMLIINIPLFVIGIRIFGSEYGIKTFFSTIMLSVYTDLFSIYFQLDRITENVLLAALYGGVLGGAGLGLVMKVGGSTGGTDIIAQIVHKYLKIGTGYALIVVDFFILSIAGLYFGMELALYALISLYVFGKVINFIIEGANYSKIAYIITDYYEEITDMIITDMQRGGTGLKAKGLYTSKDKNIIMTVLENREIHRLKEEIKKIDDKAFVIITEAYEVLGEGFTYAPIIDSGENIG